MPCQQAAQAGQRLLLEPGNLRLGYAQAGGHLLLGKLFEVAPLDDSPLARLQPGEGQGQVEAILGARLAGREHGTAPILQGSRRQARFLRRHQVRRVNPHRSRHLAH